SILPTVTLAHVDVHIKSIRSLIPKSIPQIGQLRLKLKFDHLYGQLIHGEHCCFTFGYLGGVTYTTLSQAAIAYVAIFILVTNFYLKNFHT
ncbi:hypothetical protein BLA29_009207, partial [Euroglyphus maynei]